MHKLISNLAKPQRIPLLLAFFLASLLLWGFVELADEVDDGDTLEIDQQILLFFRNPSDLNQPIGPSWFAEGVRDLTAMGSTSVLILITVGTAGFLLLNRKYRFFAFLSISVLGGWGLSSLLKTLFARPRPDLVPHLTQVMSASFPSGHSMMSAVVYLTLGALIFTLVPRWISRVYILSFSILVTILVGVSRVYLGVHYPTDVLAGWTLGSAWALICWSVAEWLKQREKIESKPY